MTRPEPSVIAPTPFLQDSINYPEGGPREDFDLIRSLPEGAATYTDQGTVARVTTVDGGHTFQGTFVLQSVSTVRLDGFINDEIPREYPPDLDRCREPSFGDGRDHLILRPAARALVNGTEVASGGSRTTYESTGKPVSYQRVLRVCQWDNDGTPSFAVSFDDTMLYRLEKREVTTEVLVWQDPHDPTAIRKLLNEDMTRDPDLMSQGAVAKITFIVPEYVASFVRH